MEKDIRFSEKKVDSSWKDHAVKERETQQPAPKASGKQGSGAEETSKPFLNLISSLGYQAMMLLGEIPDPMTGQTEVNLRGAREVIDLLGALKKKTEGQQSPEEKQAFEALLPELQMKFTSRA